MQLQFGENFKRLRKEKEMTQEKTADIFGVSCQSVSRWELGICYPDVELLPAIANYFGVTIDHLLSNDVLSKEADKAYFFEELGKMDSCGKETVAFIRLWRNISMFSHWKINGWIWAENGSLI